MKDKRKDKRKILAALLLFAISAILMTESRRIPGFADTYAHTIYRFLVEVFARGLNLIPFSVFEILLYACCLFLIGSLILQAVKGIRKHCFLKSIWNWFLNTIFCLSVIAFAYTIGCGINYATTPWSVSEDYRTGQYDDDALLALCEYLTEEVNAAAKQVHFAEDGELILPDKASVLEEARRSMALLGEEYESLSGYYPRPKEIAVSRILTLNHVTGVYSPFTIEANYNGEMPAYEIPDTICHELSHLKGYMREDEANFLAFLACMKSSSMEFRFSGLMLAYTFSVNAYYKSAGWDAYAALLGKLDPHAHLVWSKGSAFWKKYEGKVSETHAKVNDVYLKANGQKEGHKTYSHMVTLLLAWNERRAE